MRKPHKHAEVIKAWADGAEIEYLETMTSKEPYWANAPMPKWSEETMYRVKPEPKPDMVFYARILLPYFDAPPRVNGLGNCKGDLDNLKFTFDGTTGKIKSAEVL